MPTASVPNSLTRSGLPLTARIDRAHSDRARSASKEGTWPPPLLLPHRAECKDGCAVNGRIRVIMLPPSLLVPHLGGWADWSPTARVERGPSEAARSANTGDRSGYPPPLWNFSPPLWNSSSTFRPSLVSCRSSFACRQLINSLLSIDITTFNARHLRPAQSLRCHL